MIMMLDNLLLLSGYIFPRHLLTSPLTGMDWVVSFFPLCAYCLFCVSSVALLFSAFSVAVITDGLIEFDGWRNGSAMHSGIWAF